MTKLPIRLEVRFGGQVDELEKSYGLANLWEN